MSRRPDDTRTARQINRGQQKRAGDRSARIARTLMKLAPAQLRKLVVDQELRAEIERARSVTSHVARRRAERTLAGELRQFDLVALDQQLGKLEQGESADIALFHLAERWRARLIEEGAGAAAELPGGPSEELPRLLEAARRERDTGKPPGAARKLFRHVMDALKAEQAPARLDADDPDEDDAEVAEDDDSDA